MTLLLNWNAKYRNNNKFSQINSNSITAIFQASFTTFYVYPGNARLVTTFSWFMYVFISTVSCDNTYSINYKRFFFVISFKIVYILSEFTLLFNFCTNWPCKFKYSMLWRCCTSPICPAFLFFCHETCIKFINAQIRMYIGSASPACQSINWKFELWLDVRVTLKFTSS